MSTQTDNRHNNINTFIANTKTTWLKDSNTFHEGNVSINRFTISTYAINSNYHTFTEHYNTLHNVHYTNVSFFLI